MNEYYNSNCYIGTSYRGDTLSNSQFDLRINQMTLVWFLRGRGGQYNAAAQFISSTPSLFSS